MLLSLIFFKELILGKTFQYLFIYSVVRSFLFIFYVSFSNHIPLVLASIYYLRGNTSQFIREKFLFEKISSSFPFFTWFYFYGTNELCFLRQENLAF